MPYSAVINGLPVRFYIHCFPPNGPRGRELGRVDSDYQGDEDDQINLQ